MSNLLHVPEYLRDLYDESTGQLTNKEQSVSQASNEKKQTLNNQWIKEQLFTDTKALHDADTYTPIGYEKGMRLSSGKGYSVDAAEVDGTTFKNNPRTFFRQRAKLASELGVSPSEVSEQMIFDKGNETRNKSIRVLSELQNNEPYNYSTKVNEVDPITGKKLREIMTPFEGATQVDRNVPKDATGTPLPATVDVFNLGKKDKYGRPLGNVRNSITGKDLMSALNNKTDNYGYDTKYNQAKLFEDRLAELSKKDKLESDSNAIMSDEFAKTTLGQGLNTVGAGYKGAGRLANVALDTPEFISRGISKSLDTVKEDFEYYLPEFSKAVKEKYKGSLAEDLVETVKYDANLVTKELDSLGNMFKNNAEVWHHKGNQKLLQSKLGEDYDNNEGFTNVAGAMIKTAADNPLAAGETFIESLPEMMALAKKGTTGSGIFIGLVGDRVAEAEKIFIRTHSRKPNADEYAKMVGAGVLATGIDKVQANFVLNPLKKTKLGEKVLGKITNTKGINAIKRATKAIGNSKLGKATSKIPYGKTIAKGTATGITEPLQEGTQTYLEQISGKQTEDSLTSNETLKKTAIAAGQGIGAGAIGSGGVQAIVDSASIATDIANEDTTNKFTPHKDITKETDRVNSIVADDNINSLDTAQVIEESNLDPETKVDLLDAEVEKLTNPKSTSTNKVDSTSTNKIKSTTEDSVEKVDPTSADSTSKNNVDSANKNKVDSTIAEVAIILNKNNTMRASIGLESYSEQSSKSEASTLTEAPRTPVESASDTTPVNSNETTIDATESKPNQEKVDSTSENIKSNNTGLTIDSDGTVTNTDSEGVQNTDASTPSNTSETVTAPTSKGGAFSVGDKVSVGIHKGREIIGFTELKDGTPAAEIKTRYGSKLFSLDKLKRQADTAQNTTTTPIKAPQNSSNQSTLANTSNGSKDGAESLTESVIPIANTASKPSNQPTPSNGTAKNKDTASTVKPSTGTAKKVANKITTSASKVASKINNTGLVKSTKSKVKSAASKVKSKSYDFKDKLDNFMYSKGFDKNNPVHSLVREVSLGTAKDTEINELARLVQSKVSDAAVNTKNLVKEQLAQSFNPKKKVTNSQWKSINDSLLKTDAISLVNTTENLDELVEIMQSDKHRKDAIAKLESELAKYGDKGSVNAATQQANSLGYFMANGRSLMHNQMLNAHNIAQFTGLDNKAIPTLDKLSSLHAIGYTELDTLRDTIKLIESETSRELKEGDENGVQQILNLHNHFKSDSLEKNFDNNPVLAVKGYIKETFGKNVDIRIAPKSQRAKLQAEGYSLASNTPIQRDDLDNTSGAMYLYVSRGGRKSGNEMVSGIITLNDVFSKGSNDNIFSRKQLEKIHSKATTQSLRAKTKNMLDNSKNYLIPVLDGNGDITGYRYMMSENAKAEHLGMNNKANETLSNMFASVIKKGKGNLFNEGVIHSLKEDFTKYYSDSPREYTELTKDEYNKLPNHTKEVIKKVWGKQPLRIRTELKDTVIGYEKLSALNSLDKKLSNKAIVNTTPYKFALTGSQIATDLWKHTVSEVKRRIVTLYPEVVGGNLVSNMSLLYLRGVRPDKILTDMKEGAQLVMQYEEDLKKRDLLELKQNSNPKYKNSKPIQTRLDKLNKSLQDNPIHNLIDAGALTLIADDITTGGKNYLSAITDTVGLGKQGDNLADNTPQLIKDTVSHLNLSPDTDLGKAIEKLTTYGDFIARYALYKHLTQRRGVSHRDAINDAVDTFVNYNTPTGKHLQYANDLGLLMFTRWILRTLKVLGKVALDNPSRLIISEIAQKALLDIPSITDMRPDLLLSGSRTLTPSEAIEQVTAVPLYDSSSRIADML